MAGQALIAGATGLVGFELLRFLLEADYHRVVAPVRKKLPYQREKLIELRLQKTYEETLAEETGPFADAFCCLGTTIKTAGSRERFAQVDLNLPLEFARAAQRLGGRRFFIVTAMGADKNSSIFYNRTKGELEEELSKLNFQELHIFRPSLLLGQRQEFRLGERLAGSLLSELSLVFQGPLKKYKPIQARSVARAMLVAASRGSSTSPTIYRSDIIARMAEEASA
ncbi:MAG: oxidoreductase [Spirochaetales bacterium]|nr:oxidoreductase [Spirochaetales bacterium]